ncbi:sentrin-specific protease 5 [Fundulus heteroclitus]|uniref:sentrin-specific protease 5 n=1 Tax=Fundulus heteroclitus TaxID=8078 RepID=UPI00165B0F9C|nr:sentrin-specific protease 5 [Fundulus heteroclitus]XP_035993814.1 sentrin-specific protease 5 [Fundulus heteroclitus]
MCHSVKQQASHSGTLTCESMFFGLCQMQQARNYWRKAKCVNRRWGSMSSVIGVSHLSRRDKRRLYYKLQFWLWRKWSEMNRLWIFRQRRRCSGMPTGSCCHLKWKHQESQAFTCHVKDNDSSTVRTSAAVSPLRPDAGGSGEALSCPNGLPEWSQSDGLTVARSDSSESTVSAGALSQTSPTATPPSQSAEPSVQPEGATQTVKHSHTVQPLQGADGAASAGGERFRSQRAQTPQMDAALQQRDPLVQQTGSEKTKSCVNNANTDSLTREIRDFLEGFYRTYGSFVPLHIRDVLRHLKRKFNSDFNDRKNMILSEVDKYRTAIVKKSVPSFQVVYKKHVLTLEDLLTLADEQWLNDQVMNMYGELIMESSHHEVHFLNSFFHRQLMTKGYSGVRRWTKQVDLFSKSLLLVPIHLEVHWCLVTADISTKKICLYDSQGHSLQKVARNILKYLISEAKEKKNAAFEEGWTVSIEENIPQQTNENDCGVFVLEYSRCLALSRPLQFSQQDIPKIRRRIYKELCDWKLQEQD